MLGRLLAVGTLLSFIPQSPSLKQQSNFPIFLGWNSCQARSKNGGMEFHQPLWSDIRDRRSTRVLVFREKARITACDQNREQR